MLPSLAAVGVVMGTDTTAHGLERSQVFFVCFVFAFEPHLLALRGSKSLLTDLGDLVGFLGLKPGQPHVPAMLLLQPLRSQIFSFICLGPMIFRGYSHVQNVLSTLQPFCTAPIPRSGMFFSGACEMSQELGSGLGFD